MTTWNAGLLKFAAVFTEYVLPALKLFINEGVRPAFAQRRRDHLQRTAP